MSICFPHNSTQKKKEKICFTTVALFSVYLVHVLEEEECTRLLSLET